VHLIVILLQEWDNFWKLTTLLGISYRRLQVRQLDEANPVRNDETGLW
jgi:hypothetical protein